MNISLIFILIILIISVFVVIFYALKQYFSLKQRIDRIASVYMISHEEELTKTQKLLKNKYFIYVVRILYRLRILTHESNKTYAKQLASAGWLSKNVLVVFFSSQIIILIIGFLLALILVLFVPWFVSKSFFLKGFVVLLLMWIGYRLPDLYIRRAMTRYRRKLRHSFLDFLDLFLICVEAGFSNDKALERVCKELKQLHPELMEQISLLTTELQILPQRRVAWENFAERTGIEETKVVAQIINQSEQLGSSIGQTLRAQADIFRAEKLSFIEQKAMRLPTLLTLPLVVFILPALLIVLLSPTILSVINTFKNLRGGQ
ncbi:MAG TPA: type II secretion system F family protein [Gammaproteobacteria bacterium]|nr:type II secretion system F family protein [Gammaproteobacteria bacterium]